MVGDGAIATGDDVVTVAVVGDWTRVVEVTILVV